MSTFYSAENKTPVEKICPFRGATTSPVPTADEASVYSFDTVTGSHSSHNSGSTSPSSHNTTGQPKCPVIFTQEVDPVLIKTSLEDRVAYLTDFLNFTEYDANVIKKVGPSVNNIIPGLVDDLYAKLFEFDITKKVFMTRNQACRRCVLWNSIS